MSDAQAGEHPTVSPRCQVRSDLGTQCALNAGHSGGCRAVDQLLDGEKTLHEPPPSRVYDHSSGYVPGLDPIRPKRCAECGRAYITQGHVCVPKPDDPIRPKHYQGDLVMRIIEHFKLDFPLGNAIKYILRHVAKGGIEDIEKAIWYLQRWVDYKRGKIPEMPLE